MKAKKALKRLAKIEAAMANVLERYAAFTPEVRQTLQDAKATVARAKMALGVQAESVAAPPTKAAAAKPSPKKRIRVPAKKTVKAVRAKRAAAAVGGVMEIPTVSTAQETTPEEPVAPENQNVS